MDDRWVKLWDIATGGEGEPATILPDPEDSSEVLLTYSDGSSGGWYWHRDIQDWVAAESLSTAPCDVAARDSF